MSPNQSENTAALFPMLTGATCEVVDLVEWVVTTREITGNSTSKIYPIAGREGSIFFDITEVLDHIHISILVDGKLGAGALFKHYAIDYAITEQQITHITYRGLPIAVGAEARLEDMLKKLAISMKK